MRGCITIGSMAVFTPGTIHAEGVSVTELLIQRCRSNFPDPGGFLIVRCFPDSGSAYVTFEDLYVTSRCLMIIQSTKYVSVKTQLCLVNGFCVSKIATNIDLYICVYIYIYIYIYVCVCVCVCVCVSLNDGDTF